MEVKNQEGSSTNLQLSQIFQFFWKSKWKILSTGTVFALLGLLYAMTRPFEYSSSAKVLPELQNKNSMSGFRALADLAGISLDNAQISDAIRPDLYPGVLQSSPFLLAVADLKVKTRKSSSEKTLRSFLREQPERGWNIELFSSQDSSKKKEEVLISLSAKDIPSGVLFIDKAEEELLKQLASRIKSSFDKKTGIIQVAVEMPDPIVAATVAQYSVDYLTDYMTNYRSGRQTTQAKFFKKQLDAAEKRYEDAEYRLRSYRDQNRNPFMSRSTAEESRLSSELTVAQNLFVELSKQYEQTNVKSQEEAPILKVLDPPQVPLKRSSPKRAIIVVMFFVIGISLSSVLLFMTKMN